MAVPDHRFVFVCLVMAVAGQSGADECTTDEVKMSACIKPHDDELVAAFGNDSSTCNRSLISSDLCQSFSQIVLCIDNKRRSVVSCSPSAVAQINKKMEIPCTIEDFDAVCTDAPRINQGQSGADECTTDEVKMSACIKPHDDELVAAFGNDSSTCNRSLISSDLCQSFSQIVLCIDNKRRSVVSCSPSAVAQINKKMEIPCKIEDFDAVCTDAPRINQGNKNGSRREVVTLPLLMTSLMATLVVTVLSTGGR